MENIHKKFIDELIEAEKAWQGADHLTYVTLPIVKDQKLMLKALEALHKCITINISTILKLEYLYKRISLSRNPVENLEIFFRKCSKNYGLTDLHNKTIKEMLFLGKKHRESTIEFSKNGKMIIMNGSSGLINFDIEKLKEFLKLSKTLLENTNKAFRELL